MEERYQKSVIGKDINDLNGRDRHSEEIDEIITKLPSWIGRWGITFFLLILVIVVIMSSLIKYPYVIRNNIRIQSSIASRDYILENGATILAVYAQQGSVVNAGQHLLSIRLNSGNQSILAPCTGQLSYATILETGAFIKKGEKLFTVHPPTERFFGSLSVKKQFRNQIKLGQLVLIDVDDSRQNNSRIIKGRISFIADEAGSDETFAIKIDIDDLNAQPAIKHIKSASAAILTENISILSRILKNYSR